MVPHQGRRGRSPVPGRCRLLEADRWEQYNELGGIQDRERPGGNGNRAYTTALSVLDNDIPQYIHDNADGESAPVATW